MQHLRRLSGRRRSRREAGAFVVDGPVLLAEALDAGLTVESVFVGPDDAGAVDPAVAAVAERAVAAGAARHDLAPGVLARVADPVTPHGVVAVVGQPPGAIDLGVAGEAGRSRVVDPGPVLVLAGVADPGNAGTLVRSAEAAGARAVVATAGSVDLFSPKVVRAAAGSLFRVPVVVDADPTTLVAGLRAVGLRTVGTAIASAAPYDEADLTGPVALVLGNEAHGLDRDLQAGLDLLVTIPMEGLVESLNVAMAGTLVLFEAARQRRAST